MKIEQKWDLVGNQLFIVRPVRRISKWGGGVEKKCIT